MEDSTEDQNLLETMFFSDTREDEDKPLITTMRTKSKQKPMHNQK